ncbi:hypothetical protein [Paenibacillus sp. Leaf72]|uniref:hypothetical protein n=1 Tax=Paenibacillus sp. Leaf72 TaxID=1736234 RepID=UPI0012DFC332|nr:hypothetical protein [Paenibacillus sp. Leaf72]
MGNWKRGRMMAVLVAVLSLLMLTACEDRYKQQQIGEFMLTADAAYERKDFESAELVYGRILKLDPEHEETKRKVKEIASIIDQANDLIRQGDKVLKEGDLSEAQRLFSEAEDMHPYNEDDAMERNKAQFEIAAIRAHIERLAALRVQFRQIAAEVKRKEDLSSKKLSAELLALLPEAQLLLATGSAPKTTEARQYVEPLAEERDAIIAELSFYGVLPVLATNEEEYVENIKEMLAYSIKNGVYLKGEDLPLSVDAILDGIFPERAKEK